MLLAVACHRKADDYDVLDEDNLQEIRVSACEAACETMDRCDPERFVGMDPAGCFDRCMGLPVIYEDNQCGSRELLWLECLGGLECEDFQLWDYTVNLQHYVADYPCVAEVGYSADCRHSEPFDLDEDNSQYP